MQVCGYIFLVKKVYNFYSILKGSFDDMMGTVVAIMVIMIILNP